MVSDVLRTAKIGISWRWHLFRVWQTEHWNRVRWVYAGVPILGWLAWNYWMGRLYGDIIYPEHGKHSIGTNWAIVMWLNYITIEVIVTYVGSRWVYRKTGFIQ